MKDFLHTTCFKHFRTRTNQENTPEMASGTMGAETGVSFTSRMVFFDLEWFLFGLDHLNGVFLTWNPLLSEMVFFCMEIVFFPTHLWVGSSF